MASLAHTIYNPRRGEPVHGLPDPAELLDPARFPTEATVREHLFDGFVPAAYRPHPHRRQRWPAGKAQRWLAFLARHLEHRLGGTTDLAWWQLHTAAPRRVSSLAFSLAVGQVAGLLLGIPAGIAFGIPAGIAAGLAGGLASGLPAGSPAGRTEPSRGLRWQPNLGGLWTALALWVGVGAGAGIVAGLGVGLGAGLVAGLAFGQWSRLCGGSRVW
jgi:hypothetical protein